MFTYRDARYNALREFALVDIVSLCLAVVIVATRVFEFFEQTAG